MRVIWFTVEILALGIDLHWIVYMLKNKNLIGCIRKRMNGGIKRLSMQEKCEILKSIVICRHL